MITFFSTASLDARINLESSAVFWVNLSGFSFSFNSPGPLHGVEPSQLVIRSHCHRYLLPLRYLYCTRSGEIINIISSFSARETWHLREGQERWLCFLHESGSQGLQRASYFSSDNPNLCHSQLGGVRFLAFFLSLFYFLLFLSVTKAPFTPSKLVKLYQV